MTVVIVGAGPVGLCTALSLQRTYEDTEQTNTAIEVHEKATQYPDDTPQTGYNLNVTICERGLRALRYVGVAEEVILHSAVVVGVAVHTQHDGVKVFPYDAFSGEESQSTRDKKSDIHDTKNFSERFSAEQQAGSAKRPRRRVLYSISRHRLVGILRRKVVSKDIKIVYGSKFVCVQKHINAVSTSAHTSANNPRPKSNMSAVFEVTPTISSHIHSVVSRRVIKGITMLIGADGVHSRVRDCIFGTQYLGGPPFSEHKENHQHATIATKEDSSSIATTAQQHVNGGDGQEGELHKTNAYNHLAGGVSVKVYTHNVGYREVVFKGKIGALNIYDNHLQVWCGKEGMLLMLLPTTEETKTHIGVYAPLSYLRTVSAAILKRDIVECAPELANLSVGPAGVIQSVQFGSLHTVVCDGYSRDGVVLVGDAAHAMPPFLGQGLNSGLDDAYLLSQGLLSETTGNNGSSVDALMDFATSRKIDLSVILRKSHALMETYSDEAIWAGIIDSDDPDRSRLNAARRVEANGSFFEQIAFSTKGYLFALKDSGETLPPPNALFDNRNGNYHTIGKESSAGKDTAQRACVGDHVRVGQVLYQTELVKTAVRILADKNGVVTHIHYATEIGKKNKLPEFVINDTIPRNTNFEKSYDQIAHTADSLTESAPGRFDESLLSQKLRTKQLGRQITTARRSTSTMEMAKKVASNRRSSRSSNRSCHGHLCVADTMTSGRGRNGKQWRSSIEGNLYTTLVVEKPMQDLALSETDICTLQFAAAAAVVALLRELGVKALIKWPNDIWVGGKKICGILVEADCSSTVHDRQDAVSLTFYVGIGINLVPSMPFEQGRDRMECSNLDTDDLATGLGYLLPARSDLSREMILATLCNELEPLLALELPDIIALYYRSYDLLVGRDIRVRYKDGTVRKGVAMGIDPDSGHLIVSAGDLKCAGTGTPAIGSQDAQSAMVSENSHHVSCAQSQEKWLVDSTFASVRPIPSETIYIYSSDSTSKLGVELLLRAFARICDTTHYRIKAITPKEVCSGTWVEDAAAIVIGGGADLGYLRELSATHYNTDNCQIKRDGIDIIRSYVHTGGLYIGVCAGAYTACGRVLFDEGGSLEVVGERPLRFFTGDCVGPIVGEYDYASEKGARAVQIKWSDPTCIARDSQVGSSKGEESAFVYVNGGGAFDSTPLSVAEGDTNMFRTLSKDEVLNNFEVLARYDSDQIESVYQDSAAIVFAQSVESAADENQGRVLLMGPHLEFHPALLDPEDEYLSQPECLPYLHASARSIDSLLQWLLKDKCGLKI